MSMNACVYVSACVVARVACVACGGGGVSGGVRVCESDLQRPHHHQEWIVVLRKTYVDSALTPGKETLH